MKHYSYWELWHEQPYFINGVIRKYKPKKCLEIGVAAGGSAIIILNALKNNYKRTYNNKMPKIPPINHIDYGKYKTPVFDDEREDTGNPGQEFRGNGRLHGAAMREAGGEREARHGRARQGPHRTGRRALPAGHGPGGPGGAAQPPCDGL